MNAGELVDARGRKYLTAEERARFLAAARAHQLTGRADARPHPGADRLPCQRGAGATTL